MSIAGTFAEKALKFGGHLLSTTVVASPVAYVEYGTANFVPEYDKYLFDLTDIIPVSINTHLAMIISADGTTWQVASYAWQRGMQNAGGAGGYFGSAAGGATNLWHYFDYAYQGFGLGGHVIFWRGEPTNFNLRPFSFAICGINQNLGTEAFCFGGGANVAAATAAIRFYFNGGNIQSGRFRLFGMTK